MLINKTIYIFLAVAVSVFIVVFGAAEVFDGIKYFSENIWSSRQQSAGAAGESNFSGWSWSGNTGWMSFNSKNCDADGNGISEGYLGCPVAGEAVPPYGVNVNLTNGNLSGYAWSEHIGWIGFNSADVSGCPAGICQPRYNTASKKVYGWARIMNEVANNPDSSWIHLNGSNYEIKLNTQTCELEGWAWGSSNIGWISFNSKNNYSGKESGGSEYSAKSSVFCGTPILEEIPLSGGNQPVTQPDYCSSTAVIFKWVYTNKSGREAAFLRLQVDDDLGFDGDGEVVADSQKIPVIMNKSAGSTQSYQFAAGTSLPWTGTNPNYYWRVKVWDADGLESEWLSGSNSFSIPKHPYPSVNFAQSPASPSAGDPINFEDRTVYEFSPFGGSFVSRWWKFVPDAPDLVDIAPYEPENPKPIKTSAGSPVEIKVFDIAADGVNLNFSLFAKNDNIDAKGFKYECKKIVGTMDGVVGEGEDGRGIKVKPPMPIFKEVKPR